MLNQRTRVTILALLCCVPIMGTKVASREAAAANDPPPPRARAEVEAVLAKAPKPPADSPLRTLHVVLLADIKDHGPEAHDYPLWQKRWALLLGGRQAEDSEQQVNLFGPPQGDPKEIASGTPQVNVTKAWQWPSEEQFETAHLIVMQCYRSGGPTRIWSEQRVDELEKYLARGGGFVAVHPATYTRRDLSGPGGARVAALSGLAYDTSIIVRLGPIRLKIAASDHPICLGLPETIDWIDEPYWPPRGDLTQVTVLATSAESVPKGSDNVQAQPLFWTSRCGKGRVFGCVPGHFTWTFDDPYFRILLLRGMAWAAAESPYRFDHLVMRGVPLK